jgi:hypothetical protein
MMIRFTESSSSRAGEGNETFERRSTPSRRRQFHGAGLSNPSPGCAGTRGGCCLVAGGFWDSDFLGTVRT